MLAGIIRKEKPAIIHAASGYRGYEIAVMAKTLSDHFSIPWIYEVRSFHEHTWTSDSFHAKTASHTEQRMERENSLMLLADHVVTISETMKEAIIERGVDAERITVVPNAVDMDSFAPQKKKAKLIRQLGLRKKTVLGYISNISRREGHDILIKAIPLMVKTNPNIVLLIVGDGREKSNMEKLVSELHIENQVIFTGNIDHRQIKDYYSIIDLFIVPRRRDYASDLVTPLKPYEAMAMKIPLLVSNRPALLEIIGENRGFSFATENVKDLAEVAIGCLENISECGKRTEAAFKWLIKNRTWAMNAVIYKNLYADILQKHRDDNNDD